MNISFGEHDSTHHNTVLKLRLPKIIFQCEIIRIFIHWFIFHACLFICPIKQPKNSSTNLRNGFFFERRQRKSSPYFFLNKPLQLTITHLDNLSHVALYFFVKCLSNYILHFQVLKGIFLSPSPKSSLVFYILLSHQ